MPDDRPADVLDPGLTVRPMGDDAYYLNALAGDRRTVACSFDPDLDWVRATWELMEPDPRLPLVTSIAPGIAACG
jgi:hypothetical protein